MRFSLIIPTHKRMDKLTACLKSLAGQQSAPPFEVIVVFDGPEPENENRVRAQMDALSLRGQVLTQPQAGPAAARNRGARAAVGERLLFMGDDVAADPRFLFEHDRTAREHPGAAVLGYVPWAKHLNLTPFMKWLAPETGMQFCYGAITNPEDCGYQFCYTANFALPRSAWAEEPFDEDFKHAAGEDTEWSWRLARRGLRIVLNREAIVWHDHAVTLAQFVERQRRAGQAAALIWQKHPELRENRDLFPLPEAVFLSPTGRSLRDRLLLLKLAARHYLGFELRPNEYVFLLGRPYVGALLTSLAAAREGRKPKP